MASSTRKWRYGRRNGSATSVASHRREAEAEAEAGVKEKMMSKTDPQKHLATRKLQRERRARVEASSLVAPAGCAEATFPERVPQLGQRWTAVPKHYGVDQEVFQTGSSTMELLASQAIQRKRQGKEQR